MPIELVVPSVGESITEVEIGDWLKNPGESVRQDEPVVVIETEKVTVELPAPIAGTITTMLKNKGDKASVGDVIGYMEPNGVAPSISSSDNHPAVDTPITRERTPVQAPPGPSVPKPA